MTYPMTLVEFESWLENKNQWDVVGSATYGNCCPIANALRKESEVKNVKVNRDCSYVNNEVFVNPSWVKEFVEVVDTCGLLQISAEKALEIVNNLYICTVCNKYNPEGTNCGKKDNCPW